MFKSLLSCLITLLLVVTVFAHYPVAYASNDDVKFVKPCDTFVDDNHIYVLDKVDNDSVGIIQRFDTDGGNRTRYTLDTYYERIYAYGDTVYLLQDGYLCWGTLNQTNYLLEGSYSLTADYKKISSGDFVIIEQNDEKYIFACGNGYMIVIKQLDGAFYLNQPVQGCTDIAYSRTADNNYFIFAMGSEGISSFYFSNGNLISMRSNTNFDNSRYSLVGVNSIAHNQDTLSGAQLYLYDKQEGKYCQLDYINDTSAAQLDEYITDQEEQSIGIANVCNNTDNLYVYVTKGNNTVTRYAIDSSVYKLNLDTTFSLGTNSIDLPIPTSEQLTGWFVCQSTGYPTNILYGATQTIDNSVDYGSLREDDTFIVYTYDNWQNDNYYLIMFNGKYGFVEKGNKVDITADQLRFRSTQVFLQGRVVAVSHVYSAPFVAERYHIDAIPQNTVVSISDKLTIWGYNYYLIEYSVNNVQKTGWIRQESVGDIAFDSSVAIEGIYRANPPLGQQLSIYEDNTLTKHAILNEQTIYLEVGQSITVISTQDGISLVQAEIDTPEGKSYIIGYVSSDLLIDKGLTNYQALGLSLFIVSISLALFLVIIIVRRRIKVRKESEAEQFGYTDNTEDDE